GTTRCSRGFHRSRLLSGVLATCFSPATAGPFPEALAKPGTPKRRQSLEQMLAIRASDTHGPDLLLPDEPSGLAPPLVETVMSTIERLKRERVSMLLVEQNAQMARELRVLARMVGQLEGNRTHRCRHGEARV